MKKFLSILCVFVFLCGCSKKEEIVLTQERVQDFAKVLDSNDIHSIKNKLSDFEHVTAAQMAVVIVPNLDGNSIEDYSYKTATTLGIGKKNIDNGVLLFISIKDKKSRIEVGRGIEDKYPDILASRALTDASKLFKEGQYTSGILGIIGDVTQKLNPEFTQEDRKVALDKAERDVSIFYSWIFWAVVCLIILDILTVPIKNDLWIIFFLSIFASGNSGGFGGGSFGGGGASKNW